MTSKLGNDWIDCYLIEDLPGACPRPEVFQSPRISLCKETLSPFQAELVTPDLVHEKLRERFQHASIFTRVPAAMMSAFENFCRDAGYIIRDLRGCNL